MNLQRINLAALVLLLRFHAFYQASFFTLLAMNPGQILESSGISADLALNLAGLLTLVSAGQALLVVLSLLAIVWTLRGKYAGAVTGSVVGAYFLGIGIALYFSRDGVLDQYVIVDIARGALTVLLAGIDWSIRLGQKSPND
jgi:hypothetical protein